MSTFEKKCGIQSNRDRDRPKNDFTCAVSPGKHNSEPETLICKCEDEGTDRGSVMDGATVDNVMVFFSLIYNALVILLFVLRGQAYARQEAKLGPVFNALLIPFSVLWLLNLLGGRGSARLITGAFVILFLVFDLFYRTATGRKPYHHPDRWPAGLILYVFLFHLGGITLNGYAFIVSRLYGYVVLASYFGSLGAYGFYQYKYKKAKAVKE